MTRNKCIAHHCIGTSPIFESSGNNGKGRNSTKQMALESRVHGK